MSRTAQAWLQFAIAAIAVAGFFLLLRGSDNGAHRDPGGMSSDRVDIAAADLHSQSGSASPEAPEPVTTGPPDRHPADPPHLEGDWAATGEVQWVDPDVNSTQPPGTILNRPWNFEEVCNGPCRIAFARGTLYGPSVTWLVPDGSGYTADFPPVQVPCAYPRGSAYDRQPYGYSHDQYRLWWSQDHTKLLAIEHRTQTGCYSTPERPDTTRWQAVRAG